MDNEIPFSPTPAESPLPIPAKSASLLSLSFAVLFVRGNRSIQVRMGAVAVERRSHEDFKTHTANSCDEEQI